MNPADFEFVSDLLKRESGLVLTQEKVYLIENRLTPIARARSMEGLDDLVKALRTGGDQVLLREVVDAMTTNESLFFRDPRQFDNFRDNILPELIQSRAARRRLRIWSAASSTGQEPYSVAMLLAELGPKIAGWNIEILATDIAKHVLDRAAKGVFTQFEIQRGLPITMLVKYFSELEANQWQVNDAIRNMVKFQEANLLGNIELMGAFDLILCRNVLIYFDRETKAAVLDKMAKMLGSDGYLFLGGAETVIGVTDSFSPMQGLSGFYRPKGAMVAPVAVGTATPPPAVAGATASA